MAAGWGAEARAATVTGSLRRALAWAWLCAGAACGSTGDAPGACPSWPGCSGAGGRGNVCGGVVVDERFLQGSGFHKFEGARVVGTQGHAVVTGGTFSLHLGEFAGCQGRTVTYRIDVSPNGRCDDGVDLVFTASLSGLGGAFEVTGADPGSPATCADLPAGYDLDLSVAPACLPRCGTIRAGLFEGGEQPLMTTDIYLDGARDAGRGFAGALVPGRRYRVRYYWTPSPFGGGCTGTPVWSGERAVVPREDVNLVEIGVDPKVPATACF